MLKIVHYTPSIDRAWGGTSMYMQLLVKELGILVDLHIASHSSENELQMENCQVHYIPQWKKTYAMKHEWHKLLLKLNPDVIHINGCWTPSCALLQRWAQMLGYKVALTPHGMLEPWIMARHYYTRKLPALWFYQKSAIIKADYLHATAESEKQNLLNLGWNKQIAVIANGVDVENIEMKSTWKRNKEILFLSRIHVKKGLNFLIEAIAKLKAQMQGYVVRIAGEGDEVYINELRTLITQLGVNDIIHFEGGVYGNRKWDLFRQADLFVLPTHSENFGIVVAEALACGTPVITTTGTPWSELKSEQCGWWTEIGTKGTVQALKDFLALEEEVLEKMGRNGRRLVEKKYSERKVAEQFVELYKKMTRL